MKHRLLRVNELVRRQLSMIITRDMRFEDVLVTINQVDVTPDLKNAHVFVSVLGKGSAKGVIAQLDANRTVLQAEMAKEVILKYTPHLNFHLDDSIERGDRVFKILQEIAPGGEEDEEDVEEQP
ncbi:MAG: 30S ribosome-binding factor RbfA [Chthoniobacterales bacterium]|nr:30S ribosome-binding factor RbfA [Chthoniobacterales bacterium]